MKPIAAAIAGALISGGAMYTIGARTATVEAFTQDAVLAAPIETQSDQIRPSELGAPRSAVRPVSTQRTSPKPSSRTVYRPASQVDERDVDRDDDPQDRSWSKSALIIGGSAASGAGVGAAVKGKKGALIGAAIGGGAASIYEATRRR